MEYVYANFPQLESQELRSIGMCGKNLMENKRATPDFFLFLFLGGDLDTAANCLAGELG